MIKKVILVLLASSLFMGCSSKKVTDDQVKEAVEEAVVKNETALNQADSEKVPENENVAAENGGENMAAANVMPEMDEFGLQTDRFVTASGKSIGFHCVKHGSIRIDYDGLEFEIDPVTKLGDNVTAYDKYPDADYILVTHEHQDHYDPDAISNLKKEGSMVITNRRCADMLGSGDVMANGDVKELRDGIKLEAVAAYNTTEGRDKFHPKGRDNGFILTLDGFRIYIAGDTENIPEMASIKDIDVAFMPCNQPYTMTPEQLVKAAEVVRPKVLFPYHYGATNMDEVVSAMKGSAVDVRIRNYQ